MQRVTSFNPASDTPAAFDTMLGGAASLGKLYVWNESNYAITFTLAAGKSLTVPPWIGYPITPRPYPMPSVSWAVDYSLNIGSQPISTVIVEQYDADEPLPSQEPISLSSRVTNVGNQGGTGTGNSLIQDGNPPATQLIEATPNDQGVSAEKWNNDASGLKQILSAGTQRTVMQVTRGDASATKALIQFGDANDTSITTFYGTLSGGVSATDAVNLTPVGHSSAAHAQFGGAAPTHSFVVFDTAGGTLIGQQSFSGVGAGTVSHGLSWTPTFIGITTTENNSTETVGVDSIGSSTCQVNQGVSGWPWIGLAYAH